MLHHEQEEPLMHTCYRDYYPSLHNVARGGLAAVGYKTKLVSIHKPQELLLLEDITMYHLDAAEYVYAKCPVHNEHESVRGDSNQVVRAPRLPTQKAMSAGESFDRTCPSP